jgi:hypothetical protein
MYLLPLLPKSLINVIVVVTTAAVVVVVGSPTIKSYLTFPRKLLLNIDRNGK